MNEHRSHAARQHRDESRLSCAAFSSHFCVARHSWWLALRLRKNQTDWHTNRKTITLLSNSKKGINQWVSPAHNSPRTDTFDVDAKNYCRASAIKYVRVINYTGSWKLHLAREWWKISIFPATRRLALSVTASPAAGSRANEDTHAERVFREILRYAHRSWRCWHSESEVMMHEFKCRRWFRGLSSVCLHDSDRNEHVTCAVWLFLECLFTLFRFTIRLSPPNAEHNNEARASVCAVGWVCLCLSQMFALDMQTVWLIN